jgi:hypothetical protein
MVDLIEIAKPLTRLKSIRQNQEPAGALAGAGKTCIEPMRDEFPSKMPGIPEMPQESSRAASCYRLSVFRRIVGTSGRAWHTFVFVLKPYSIASVACGGEIAHAAVDNKRMVPIVAREVDTDTVPEALRKSGTNQRWLNGCVLMRFSPSQGSAQVLC